MKNEVCYVLDHAAPLFRVRRYQSLLFVSIEICTIIMYIGTKLFYETTLGKSGPSGQQTRRYFIEVSGVGCQEGEAQNPEH